MNLRYRLMLLCTLLTALGLLLGLTYRMLSSRNIIHQEMLGTVQIAEQFLSAMLPSNGELDLSESNIAAELNEERFAVVKELQLILVRNKERQYLNEPMQAKLVAPAWFAFLLETPLIERRFVLGREPSQYLLLITNPNNEVNETWQETKRFVFFWLLMLAIFNGILYWGVGRWLALVPKIVASLQRAEQGDFSGEVPATTLPELHGIVEQLNRLVRVLATSKAENERLRGMSLHIQEEERRNLARELHDELGQALTAIKAIAWSLAQSSQQLDPVLRQGMQRIANISAATSQRVKQLLVQLRPALLDELGLIPSLEMMVAEWNEHHQGCHCQLTVDPAYAELNDYQRIHLYRIVQEVLTNTAKHAEARHLRLELTAGTEFEMMIEDDGKGFDPTAAHEGMGINGIRERSQALRGQLSLFAKQGAGVRYRIVFPRLS
jgi:two-component system, NarL family, sensor histidine kinase UhpB